MKKNLSRVVGKLTCERGRFKEDYRVRRDHENGLGEFIFDAPALCRVNFQIFPDDR